MNDRERILAAQLASMDRNYDPKLIADELKRDEEENADWYYRMRAVEKPKYLEHQHLQDDSFRRGMLIDELPTPLTGEVIVKLDAPKQQGFLYVKYFSHHESPIVTVVRVSDDDRGAYSVGDKVVIDSNTYLNTAKNWRRTIRFNCDNQIYIVVVARDILAIVE